MIPTVHVDKEHHRQGRYSLTDTGSGHVWGVCDEAEGLFRESLRGTYELFGWVPDGAEVRGWVGSRVWLVPEDRTLGPWLLEDAESLGRYRVLLTGLDDRQGPPEGYRAPVRLHDGYRWLGSCGEFARVLPPEQAEPPLVLRGLAPGDRLRRALARGTRRALDLEEAWLEIRDDRGEPLTDRLLRPKVRTWRTSSRRPDLIDLELDTDLAPVPGYARPVWERWLAGPPGGPGAWTGLETRRRGAWLDLVRERGCRLERQDREAGHPYELDGRHITDEPGFYLALGEAVNGPGGGCLDALVDCLRGNFGCTAPATLVWQDAAIARQHLSQVLTPAGERYDLVALVLEVLVEGGMQVTFA
ncbi:barstar family protein [Streptomyces sp. NPDC001903]|uniref:barstar family protein n=1 Tax=Streptomyces sp. NPDC001903 TaxID=3364622 RepID=UPI00369D75E5